MQRTIYMQFAIKLRRLGDELKLAPVGKTKPLESTGGVYDYGVARDVVVLMLALMLMSVLLLVVVPSETTQSFCCFFQCFCDNDSVIVDVE